jgi:hypothetical protein
MTAEYCCSREITLRHVVAVWGLPGEKKGILIKIKNGETAAPLDCDIMSQLSQLLGKT